MADFLRAAVVLLDRETRAASTSASGQDVRAVQAVLAATERVKQRIVGHDEAIEKIKAQLLLRAANKAHNFLPITLVGPSGNGKTSLAEAFAEEMKYAKVKILVDQITDERHMGGADGIYQGSHCGFLVGKVLEKKSERAFVILDELDKPMQPWVHGQLRILMDRERSNVEDAYLGFPLDLSEAIVIVACNNKSMLPSYVLDRLGQGVIDTHALSGSQLLEMLRRDANTAEADHGFVIEDAALEAILETCVTGTTLPSARQVHDRFASLLNAVLAENVQRQVSLPAVRTVCASIDDPSRLTAATVKRILVDKETAFELRFQAALEGFMQGQQRFQFQGTFVEMMHAYSALSQLAIRAEDGSVVHFNPPDAEKQ